MKRILLLTLFALAMIPIAMGANHNNKKKKAVAAPDNKEVHWLSMDELQVKMKENPKKVYMDIYTDWCGWCKRMDATTFKNPDVVKYMNDNFYCVRFNAETQQPVHFLGKDYKFSPQYRANELAAQLMQGKMSYPTAIFMEKSFTTTIPIPGYHPVSEMEMILKYLAEDVYKKQPFNEYQKTFKPTWKETAMEQQASATPMEH